MKLRFNEIGFNELALVVLVLLPSLAGVWDKAFVISFPGIVSTISGNTMLDPTRLVGAVTGLIAELKSAITGGAPLFTGGIPRKFAV